MELGAALSTIKEDLNKCGAHFTFAPHVRDFVYVMNLFWCLQTESTQGCCQTWYAAGQINRDQIFNKVVLIFCSVGELSVVKLLALS